MAKPKQKVVFRRIRGRIVPIKTNKAKRTAVAGATGAGAVVAADAARTKRVYANKKSGITIDRKKFSLQPFAPEMPGDKLVMNKRGKKVGSVAYYRTYEKKGQFGISWLGVKSKFRGKGHSKLLTKQAAREIKRKGGTELFNQVVHKRSLDTNWSKRDSLVREVKAGHKKYLGGLFKFKKTRLQKITKTQGAKNIKNFRKKGWLTSNVFRQTKLSDIRQGKMKPFRTGKNKLQLAAGLAVAGYGAYSLSRKEK